MRINKLLFLISFFSGLFTVGIGIALHFLGQNSVAYTYSKNGIGTTTFGGFHAVFLGIAMLLMSIWNYCSWKNEVKAREKRLIEENAHSGKKIKKNRFFKRLQQKNLISKQEKSI